MQSRYTLDAESQKCNPESGHKHRPKGVKYLWDIIYKGFLAEEDTMPAAGWL